MSEAAALILLHLALAGFAGSTILVMLALPRSDRRLLLVARGLLLPSALLLAALLALTGIVEQRFPAGNLDETLVCLVAALTLAAPALDVLRSLPVLTVGIAPVATVMLLWSIGLRVASSARPEPITRGFLPAIHAIATICAFVVFALAFVAALLYLLEQGRLKSGAQPPFPVLMPSLERLHRMMIGYVGLGMILLTAGILLGYLYARSTFSDQAWRLDPKILTTSLTWLGYLAVLILSFVPACKGRRVAVGTIVCFVLVVLTLWGGIFWSGFHRFV